MSCPAISWNTLHVSPHIGVLLNIHEEHLDHYGTMEKYIHCQTTDLSASASAGSPVLWNGCDSGRLVPAVPGFITVSDQNFDADVLLGGSQNSF